MWNIICSVIFSHENGFWKGNNSCEKYRYIYNFSTFVFYFFNLFSMPVKKAAKKTAKKAAPKKAPKKAVAKKAKAAPKKAAKKVAKKK